MKGLFSLIFFLASVYCYSQTWTVRDDDAKSDYEYTVITRDQYQRLLRQYEANNPYCIMQYTDVLEMENHGRVISGTRPTLRGYYYLLVKIKPHLNLMTDKEKQVLSMANMTNSLIYGNENTGRMSLTFVSQYGMMIPGAVDVDSNEYPRKYNQFLGFVNGR